MNVDINDLLKRTPILLTVLGVLLVSIAGLGGLPFGNAQLPAMSPVWRYILAGSGGILLIIGVILLLKEYKRDNVKNDSLKYSDALEILKRQTSADKFFSTRTSENILISQAKEEIWLIQETGSKVIEDNLKTISSLLQKGGKVRLIIASTDSDIVNLIAFRNKNLSAKDIAARQREALRKIKALITSTRSASGILEVRYIRYPLETTSIFVDPQSAQPESRLGLIRMVGFQNFFDDKRDFVIIFNKEPKTYQYFKQQFLEMWKLAENRQIDS
jgi:hypothetical protein